MTPLARNLLCALRIYIMCVLGACLACCLNMLYLSIHNGSPDVMSRFNAFGEWYIEIALVMPLVVLVPLWLYYDHARLVSFLLDDEFKGVR